MARVAGRCSGPTRLAALLALAAGCAGCSGEEATRPPPPAPAPAPPPSAPDAAVPAFPSVDPVSGVQLDEAPASARAAPARSRHRAARPIDITLKSEPPGALAAVDGRPVGTTPTFWAGESDGLEHEFTFALRGHAMARYRFVPVTSGVLHARLEPVAADAPIGDLGPLIAPNLAPDAGLPASPGAATPLAPPPAAAAPAPAEAPKRGEPGPAGLGPLP